MAVNPNGLSTYGSSLTTTGLDRLVSDGLRQNASKIVRTTALEILGLAQGFAPVDTGYLKASLQLGSPDNVFEMAPGGTEALVGTSVPYAVFQEFGTRKMRAQPFLSPAVELLREAWAERVANLFGDTVQGL